MIKNGKMCDNCGIRPSCTAVTKKNRHGELIRYYKKNCRTCIKYPELHDKAKVKRCNACHQEFHPVCLDVDHVNGNNKDNSYNNLQIICANCHRLKSHLCRDYVKKEHR